MPTIIDFHTHIFPEHVAEKAMVALGETYGARPEGVATLSGLREAMDEAGVERAVLCPVATRPEQVPSINRWIVRANEGLDRPRFFPFGALHPDFPEPEAELAYLRDQGVRGIKLQPHFQSYALEDPATLRMFELLEDFVVLLHAGQEIKPIPHVPTTPEKLRALHERFPRQRLVIAHLGGYKMWEEAEACLVGQEVYLDLAYTFGKLGDADIARIIAAHGAERVVFASDYPWQRPAEALADLRRLGLPPEQERLILSENAARLLGLV